MTFSVSQALLTWFDQYGRHDLPWQKPRDPYRVWLSEIMLQQTQVSTVVAYFIQFLQAFPTIQHLAEASIDQVLALWAGLGYYSRAKNLHRTAQILVENHQGQFPQSLSALMALPGIGRSTAGAIMAQAFGQFGVICDGNVKRTLARFHALPGHPSSPLFQKAVWQWAEKHTPNTRLADYSQAIMDVGALICTRSKPKCGQCPLHSACLAHQHNLVAQFPHKKIVKPKPIKHTQLVVIRHQQQLLLQKRPLSGLWNGLWCLPTLEEFSAWQSRYAWRIQQQQALASFRHVFSHFALDIEPQLIDIATDQSWQVAEAHNWQWFDFAEALKLGIPAPIKKILLQCP